MNEIQQAVKAIADGYPYGIEPYESEIFVWVENPNYQPDDGSNPRLIIRATLGKTVS